MSCAVVGATSADCVVVPILNVVGSMSMVVVSEAVVTNSMVVANADGVVVLSEAVVTDSDVISKLSVDKIVENCAVVIFNSVVVDSVVTGNVVLVDVI